MKKGKAAKHYIYIYICEAQTRREILGRMNASYICENVRGGWGERKEKLE